MKYIRTKDGIFEVEKKERAYFEGQPWLYYCKGKYGLVEEKDILSQADTIEELCDEFKVVKYGAYGKLNPHSLSDFKILKQRNNYPDAQIFGYVMWLDENNILQTKVVAKMNEKGELELL